MSEIDFRADETLERDIEIPTRLELNDPISEEPIIDEHGKPVFLMLYSAQSETFQKRAFAIQARTKIRSRHSRKADLTFAQQKRVEAEIYAAAIGEEWNIAKKQPDGTWRRIDAPCTPENAVNWVMANPLYRAQISSVTDDLEAYAGDGEGNFTIKALSPSTKVLKPKAA